MVKISGNFLDIFIACNPVGTDISSSTPVIMINSVSTPLLKLAKVSLTQKIRINIHEMTLNIRASTPANSHLKVNSSV